MSFADLRQVLMHFARELFGEDTKIRLRPSYFPFTEPSAKWTFRARFAVEVFAISVSKVDG